MGDDDVWSMSEMDAKVTFCDLFFCPPSRRNVCRSEVRILLTESHYPLYGTPCSQEAVSFDVSERSFIYKSW